MVENIYCLSDQYRKLLRRYYRSFYRRLANGERVPETEAQQHFVAVCEGRLPPQTVHEFAYTSFKKYCSLSGTAEEEAAARDFTFAAPRPELLRRVETAAVPSPAHQVRQQTGSYICHRGLCRERGGRALFQLGRPERVFIIYACSFWLGTICWQGVNVTKPVERVD